MKVTITQLKAPWPMGAKVGDVIELQGFDGMPDWAKGKCRPVADDAEAAQVLERSALPKVEVKAPTKAEPAAPAVDPDALAAAEALLAEARTEADELRARVVAAEAESAKLREALAAAEQAAAAKGKKG